MHALRVVTDLDECEALWRDVVPVEQLTDLWEVRSCFHRHFDRLPCFLVVEDGDDVAGLLPLSWVEESECYAYFPGETWEGHTWIEQNRVVASSRDVFETLLGHCPSPYHLRYLVDTPRREQTVDEIGYLFVPPRYDYDLENYFQEFSHRSAKRVKREIASIEALGVRYRHDDRADFDDLVRLNVERFGSRSYFYDRRFREGFRSLLCFLDDRGWLRMTTVLIEGRVAAVDMGCMHRGTYTLLAGGTNGDYPGVAKLINVHHMRRACEERVDVADFLCGDFSWKKQFHLTPRPLYLLSNVPVETTQHEEVAVGSAACVG